MNEENIQIIVNNHFYNECMSTEINPVYSHGSISTDNNAFSTDDDISIRIHAVEDVRNIRTFKHYNKSFSTDAVDEQVRINSKTDNCSKAPIKSNKKEQWSDRIEYLFNLIGFVVGLGSIWKFPYLIFKYGGIFLLPYTLFYVFFGLPLFVLEVYMGQFTTRGCIECWGTCQLLRALGIGMIALTVGGTFQYVMYIVWAFKYLILSFFNPLPWSAQLMNQSSLSSQIYYQDFGLNTSSFHGTGTMGAPLWDITLCALLMWLCLLICLFHGLKYSGKLVYFTVSYPYFAIIILIFHGISLPGSNIGLSKYFSSGSASNINMWSDAAIQIILMLSIGEGGLASLSGFTSFRSNLIVNSLIVSLLDFFTGIFATVFVFSYIGYLELNFNYATSIINQIASTGIGFIVIPQAFSTVYNSQIWSVMFFLLLIFIGFDTALAFLRIVLVGIFEFFSEKYPRYVTIGLCGFGFISSIAFSTPGGLYFFTIVDFFSSTWTKLFISVLMNIMVLAIYGGKEITDDIEFMLSESSVTLKCWPYIKWYFLITWYSCSPIILLTFLFYKLYSLGTSRFTLFINNSTYYYTNSEIAGGWLIALCIPCSIVAGLIYYLVRSEGNVLERFKNIYNSNPGSKPWYPVMPNDIKDLQAFKDKKKQPQVDLEMQNV